MSGHAHRDRQNCDGQRESLEWDSLRGVGTKARFQGQMVMENELKMANIGRHITSGEDAAVTCENLLQRLEMAHFCISQGH